MSVQSRLILTLTPADARSFAHVGGRECKGSSAIRAQPMWRGAPTVPEHAIDCPIRSGAEDAWSSETRFMESSRCPYPRPGRCTTIAT